MNQKTKYIAMLAILPLVAVAITPDYIGVADAATATAKNDASVGHLSGARAYGSATQDIVCGGALCSESTANVIPVKAATEEELPGVSPIVRIVSVNNYSGESQNTFNAIFEVSAGDDNVQNVQILVSSDIESVETTIGGLFAHDSSINSIKIVALDPTSVTAEILSFQLND